MIAPPSANKRPRLGAGRLLSTIDLSGLSVSEQNLEGLLLSNADTLQVLRLSGCGLGRQGRLSSSFGSHVLARLTRLTHLDLANNHLDEADVRNLVPALYRLSRTQGSALTTVDLRGNNVPPKLKLLLHQELPLPRLLA